jgi:anthranilate phosphoribosyltransferase
MLEYLNKVLARRDLSAGEMETVVNLITANEVPHAQVGAFLAALRMKGESLSELLGAARVLRSHAVPIHCGRGGILDIVGTGGDGGISFNVSTTSALVAAGAGATVAKHGNRAVSGKCGAADVLKELGFNLDAEPAAMEDSIKTNGIGFLFAAHLHPVLGSVAVLRRELKIRTIFNMLGPLCNPAGADLMVVGVYDPNLTELFANVLKDLGVRRAMVVHGRDGLDEISCADSTRVAELCDGAVKSYEIFPEMLIGQRYRLSDIAGGDAAVNAAILRRVIGGKDHGAARAIVMLNAGAAIYVAGLAPTLAAGVELAGAVIDRGAAARKLELLIEASRP